MRLCFVAPGPTPGTAHATRRLASRPIHGSISVAQALLAADVVDELRLAIGPMIAGRGRRLLDGSSPTQVEIDPKRDLTDWLSGRRLSRPSLGRIGPGEQMCALGLERPSCGGTLELARAPTGAAELGQQVRLPTLGRRW